MANKKPNFIWTYNVGKTLGLSKLVYAASMLRVPEMVIKRVQEKITKFLWKNMIK